MPCATGLVPLWGPARCLTYDFAAEGGMFWIVKGGRRAGH